MIAFWMRQLQLALGICQQASAGLPLLIILGLAAGRRGNGGFFLSGNRACLDLGLFLAFWGIFYFPTAYLAEILAYGGTESPIWQPFFASPGLPWAASMLAQTGGFIFLCAAKYGMPKNLGEAYRLRDLRVPLIFCLCALFCLGATFFLINWPFAGYPPGLSGERVFQAVLKNSFRKYFTAFTPAGGVALAWALWKLKKPASEANRLLACRWLAAWAFAGYLPWLLQTWAILIGVSLRGDFSGAGPDYLSWHIASISILSLALCFWLCQTLSKKILPWADIGALALFVVFTWMP